MWPTPAPQKDLDAYNSNCHKKQGVEFDIYKEET
jgi:hypothetical protein